MGKGLSSPLVTVSITLTVFQPGEVVVVDSVWVVLVSKYFPSKEGSSKYSSN